MYTPTWLKQIDLFQTSTESRSAIREWHVFYITGRRDAVRYSGRCAQRCTTSSTDWGATSAVFLHLAEREREQGQIRKEVSLFFFLLQGIRKELSVRPRPRSWRADVARGWTCSNREAAQARVLWVCCPSRFWKMRLCGQQPKGERVSESANTRTAAELDGPRPSFLSSCPFACH